MRVVLIIRSMALLVAVLTVALAIFAGGRPAHTRYLRIARYAAIAGFSAHVLSNAVAAVDAVIEILTIGCALVYCTSGFAVPLRRATRTSWRRPEVPRSTRLHAPLTRRTLTGRRVPIDRLIVSADDPRGLARALA